MGRRTNEISNTDSVIDSRDIIARIEELEELYDEFKEEQEGEEINAKDEEWEYYDELKELKDLEEECRDFDDWQYGLTLIHESYFVDYCKDLVEDIGDLPQNLADYIVIDWEATAENLKVDYSEVDFGGETYYVR